MNNNIYDNVNGILVNSEGEAYNPECGSAHVIISEKAISVQKCNGSQVYEVVETWALLTNHVNDSIQNEIHAINGTVKGVEHNFEMVMRKHGLKNALGLHRIKEITYEIKKIKNYANCEPCKC